MTLVALDWGTSSLRGALLDDDGRVLKERSFARGILTVDPGGFEAVFNSCFGDWMQPGTLCLIAGMAGSRQGWLEAPYCPCPAGFADIAAQLAWVEPGRIAIVPGLSIEKNGMPDVMRGEETQVFGALQLLGLTDARLVLPGTHSKWVTVTNHRVTNFSTWMTGEFYSLLRQHSLLARTLPLGDSAHVPQAFEQGVRCALLGKSLLSTTFSARALALFDRMPADAMPSYLSGLVIGEELRCQNFKNSDTLTLMGAPELCARYAQALTLIGITVQIIGNQATWLGLHALAQTLKNTHP